MSDRPAVQDAAARAEACYFARALFRAPSPAQWEWLHDPETQAMWRQLASGLGGGLAAAEPGVLEEALAALLPRTAAGYESEFIAAFEVGTPQPPVPLIESHYNKRDPVPRILHENILFHQAFGLRLKASANETADHLRHQLEFLGWLYELEAQPAASGNDAEAERRLQLRQARADFARRHLLSWLPAAAAAAERTRSAGWIRAWLVLAHGLARGAAGADDAPEVA